MTVETQAQGKWWAAPSDAPVAYCVALGATLRQLRTLTGRSGSAVAREVLDTRPNQLARYESGEAKPTLEAICLLCAEYGVNPIELVTRIAVLTDPHAPQYRTWPDEARVWWVARQYDAAMPIRGENDRRRAERRLQLAVEDTAAP